MSEQILVCYEDEDIEEVAMKMSDAQVRRFPVLSRDDERLVGIVSLGDLATKDREEDAVTGQVLEDISEPTDYGES